MLKRELTKIEKYALIGLIVVICLYFYITKVQVPTYKKYKEIKMNLNNIESEVKNLGSKPDVEEARKELEATEEEAEEVNNELAQIIDNNKSQDISSAMETLVQVNKLSAGNGIIVDKIMLSSKHLNPEGSEEEDKKSENTEQIKEPEAEQAPTPEESQASEEVQEQGQTIKDGPLNSFNWEVYDIHFQGGYTNIANFIDSLKNTDKIVRIDYITLSRTGDADNYSAYIKIYI